MIAELIGQTVQVIVSNKRLKSFLVAEEVNEEAVLRDNSLGCEFKRLLLNPEKQEFQSKMRLI
jgi:hypothetical protein